jgi:uncharacterized protein
MQLFDAALITDKRISSDGYMRAVVHAARSGIYEYTASEVGAPETFPRDAIINVYRPADEVFAPESMASFINKPVTLGHPQVSVDATNYREHVRGNVGRARENGQWLDFDVALMDAEIIKAIDNGTRELSNGYTCQLEWADGTFDGKPYQAIQRNIRGNHLAVVDKGRAGSECRIGDGQKFATCDSIPALGVNEVTTKTITVDGVPIQATDAAEAVINKLQKALADMTAKMKAEEEADESDMKKTKDEISARDGQIAVLQKQLADAEVTPAKLDALVAARAKVLDTAKAILPKLDVSAMSDADIMKAAVTSALGDAAANLDDSAIKGAFAMLSVKAPVNDGLVTLIKSGVDTNDAAKVSDAYTARQDYLANAHKRPQTRLAS